MPFYYCNMATKRKSQEKRIADDAAVYSASPLPLALPLPKLIESIKKGLPFSGFEKLRSLLGVAAKELAGTLQIATRTLAHRREAGRLRPDESERLYRVARLFDRAIELMGSEEAARTWFTTPKRALGGVSPLQFADTEPGAREVEHLIGRLEHGVFS